MKNANENSRRKLEANDKNHFKERIENILFEHTEGLSIEEISKFVKAHRHTVRKYIQDLVGSGTVHQRDLGTIKLHYLSSRMIPSSTEKEILEKLRSQIK
jgi:Fic family protein